MNRVYDPTIEKVAQAFPRVDVTDILGARKVVAEFCEALQKSTGRPRHDQIEEVERTIPGPEGAPPLPIRLYVSKDRTEAGPAFVNFHGGAFIMGDLESEHPRCLAMAAEGGAVSVGVDYRLAPENPFPAGVEDCYAALRWVAANAEELRVDPNRITIGGGSAGGNLCAAVALMARDRGGPKIAFQMLFYPVVDDRSETDSMKAGTDLYIWDYWNNLRMWDHYIGRDRVEVSPYAAPARAENLSGLPPAYVMTCEHDPLRDEGILYAMRLMAAGVPVELHHYPGTVHGFDFLAQSDISTLAIREGVEAFKRAMGKAA
ncbi:MAG: esterase [Nitrospirales bacterium]|nr:MAG: esterase [Nitrospirales bacterium]